VKALKNIQKGLILFLDGVLDVSHNRIIMIPGEKKRPSLNSQEQLESWLIVKDHSLQVQE